MSTIYHGNPAGPVVLAYTMPEDSDGPPRTADYVVSAIGLADDVARLDARTRGGALERVFFDFIVTPATTTWIYDHVTGALIQQSNAGPVPGVVPLKLPDGATITGLKMWLQGGAGHGALPANLPTVQLVESTLATGTTTNLATLTDAPVNVAAYEAVHVLSGAVGGSPVVAAATKRYYARVNGESGANSLNPALLTIFGVAVGFTLASIDKGAA